jgi:hypothetical protein
MIEAELQLRPGESSLASIGQLLGHRLVIPAFQRPYDWADQQVDELISDLRESVRRGTPLFLGLVVLSKDKFDDLLVIDGQQRLTTLMLALAASGGADQVQQGFGITGLWVKPRRADVGFTRALIRNESEPPATLSQWLLGSAFARLTAAQLSMDAILRCQVICYVAPTIAGATGLFERINLRGKKVSQFDLVKNKLIEWAGVGQDDRSRHELEELITSRYDRLYSILDPHGKTSAFDSDKLLRVHWILHTPQTFVSGDRVMDRITACLEELKNDGLAIARWIEAYLDSLVRVCDLWVWLERPYEVQRPSADGELRKAVLSFARVDREAEHQPLLVATILRFGNDAKDVVTFCEINTFRAALAKKNSNYGRSVKWRLARQLHQRTLVDGCGTPIDKPKDLVHQLFWLTTPYWNKREAAEFGDELTQEMIASQVFPEDALDNPKFYSHYTKLVHYFFWNYGVHLSQSEWASRVKVDLNPFTEENWWSDDGFRSWDIEHIYPRNPHDRETPAGRRFLKTMEPWLHHLGNLTVLPIRDNRGMGNAVFQEKLAWMGEQRKVAFNELLHDVDYRGRLSDKPYWGRNNCGRRLDHFRACAGQVWGTAAVRLLGVGPHDSRIQGEEDLGEDEESADGQG